MMRKIWITLPFLLLAGCAGKPTTYLTLQTAGPPAGPPGQEGGPAIAVSQVEIPPSIDRLHFTTATGQGTLHVAGDTQWAGPLGPMSRIVLAQDLAARLPGRDVLMPGDTVPQGGAALVQVTVQKFMPDASGTVTLQADWSVSKPDGNGELARGRFARTVPGAARPAAEAQDMSKALGLLADAIAAKIANGE